MNDSTTTTVRHGIYLDREEEFVSAVPEPLVGYTLWANDVQYDADDVRDMAAGLQEQAARIERLDERNRMLGHDKVRYQQAIRSALAELVDDGDLERAKANELLNGLGIDQLTTRYRALIKVEHEVEFESTANEDQIRAALYDCNFGVDSTDSTLEDFDHSDSTVDSVIVEVAD